MNSFSDGSCTNPFSRITLLRAFLKLYIFIGEHALTAYNLEQLLVECELGAVIHVIISLFNELFKNEWTLLLIQSFLSSYAAWLSK